MLRLIAVAVALLLLAGCGGDPADGTPSPTPSPTVSASPTPTPPAMPEEAKADTKAGAIAFVKYYIELVNHAQATGDVEPLRQASDPKCTACLDAIEAVEKLTASGGHTEGGGWKLVRASAAQNPAIKAWLVTSRIEYADQIVVRPGEGEKHSGAGKYTMEFTVATDEKPVIREWRRLS